jgi:hypothetical protein
MNEGYGEPLQTGTASSWTKQIRNANVKKYLF